MTDNEKIKKFEDIQNTLWKWATGDLKLHKTLAKIWIDFFKIPKPKEGK